MSRTPNIGRRGSRLGVCSGLKHHICRLRVRTIENPVVGAALLHRSDLLSFQSLFDFKVRALFCSLKLEAGQTRGRKHDSQPKSEVFSWWLGSVYCAGGCEEVQEVRSPPSPAARLPLHTRMTQMKWSYGTLGLPVCLWVPLRNTPRIAKWGLDFLRLSGAGCLTRSGRRNWWMGWCLMPRFALCHSIWFWIPTFKMAYKWLKVVVFLLKSSIAY